MTKPLLSTPMRITASERRNVAGEFRVLVFNALNQVIESHSYYTYSRADQIHTAIDMSTRLGIPIIPTILDDHLPAYITLYQRRNVFGEYVVKCWAKSTGKADRELTKLSFRSEDYSTAVLVSVKLSARYGVPVKHSKTRLKLS